MSYCTVADIGPEATIADVRRAAWVIENYTSPHTLYTPMSKWEAGPEGVSRMGSEVDLDVYYGVVSITNIELWASGDRTAPSLVLPLPKGSILVDRRSIRLPERARAHVLAVNPIVIEGARGYSTLATLSAGDDLLAGQSVLRGGRVVLIESDSAALVDDQLIKPPEVLVDCAVSIAKRMNTIRNDSKAQFDDQMSRIVDGIEGILGAFRP